MDKLQDNEAKIVLSQMNRMKKVLETDRLYFRELLPSDVEFMFELDSDPAVVLYTGDAPLTHRDQAHQRIEGIRQQYQDYGVGRWAAVLKDTNAFMDEGNLCGWYEMVNTPVRAK